MSAVRRPVRTRWINRTSSNRFSFFLTIVADVGALGIFAVTSSFVIPEVMDIMGAIHEAVKRWNLQRGLERGREEGREEGRRERDALFRKWLSEEKAKGNRGFREDPPFLDNGNQD